MADTADIDVNKMLVPSSNMLPFSSKDEDRVDVNGSPSLAAVNALLATVAHAPGPAIIPDTFHPFPKLPLELRLRIWGFAAPEPAVIAQSRSHKTGCGFLFIRSIPAVLHACQESRDEFLEDNPNDPSLARRRRDHPVYKLHSQSTRTRNGKRGFYMCTDIDTFWCMENDPDTSPSQYTRISLLANLSIAQTLKYLVLTYEGGLWMSVLQSFCGVLPALETLTLLIPESYFRRNSWMPVPYLPEVHGELVLDGMNTIHLIHKVKLVQDYVKDLVAHSAILSPTKKLPAVKFRFEKQFMEMESIVLPKAFEDPGVELDQENEAIDRARKAEKEKEMRKAKLSKKNDKSFS